METIQVVLDKPLLQEANRQAKKTKVNRSALIRDALREHLQRVRQKELEEQDRQGYLKHPDSEAEALLWEKEAAWPED
jgi:metal-responsive CopG/Arc/MetJ family transcriptional regulator